MLIAGLALPVTLITCGESAASSVSVIVSVRSPAASGEKVATIVQVALAAIAPVQDTFVVVKSLTLFPPMTTEEMWRVAVPEFVTVIVTELLAVPCVIVAKLTGLGDTVTTGAGGGGAAPTPPS